MESEQLPDLGPRRRQPPRTVIRRPHAQGEIAMQEGQVRGKAQHHTEPKEYEHAAAAVHQIALQRVQSQQSEADNERVTARLGGAKHQPVIAGEKQSGEDRLGEAAAACQQRRRRHGRQPRRERMQAIQPPIRTGGTEPQKQRVELVIVVVMLVRAGDNLPRRGGGASELPRPNFIEPKFGGHRRQTQQRRQRQDAQQQYARRSLIAPAEGHDTLR